MGHKVRSQIRRWRPELLIVVLLLVLTAILHELGIRRTSLLSMYVWPVVLAGYYFGRSRALVAALVAAVLVGTFAFVVPGAFTSPRIGASQVWLDIGIWGALLVATAAMIGHLYEVKRCAFEELHGAYNGVLELLSKFIDTADNYTEAHSVRVARYAMEIARRLALPSADREDIRVAALLHDVGKLEVKSGLLRKAGALTSPERREMRRHPANGAWLLGRMGGMLHNAIPLVLYHHERMDGRGYYRLRGDEIPLGARILAVADAFDAMTTSRAYRAAMPRQRACQILEDESGKQFDAEVVRVFLQALRDPTCDLDEVHTQGAALASVAAITPPDPDRDVGQAAI